MRAGYREPEVKGCRIRQKWTRHRARLVLNAAFAATLSQKRSDFACLPRNGRVHRVIPVVPPPWGRAGRDSGLVVGAIAPHLKTSPPTCRRVRAIARPGRQISFWLKDNG